MRAVYEGGTGRQAEHTSQSEPHVYACCSIHQRGLSGVDTLEHELQGEAEVSRSSSATVPVTWQRTWTVDAHRKQEGG